METFLKRLGWSKFFQDFLEEGELSSFKLGRVLEENKESYVIMTELGQAYASVSGRFRFDAVARLDFPTVGDWILVRDFSQEDFESGNSIIIEKILPRKTLLTRLLVTGKAVPGGESQPLAANIDYVFVMTSMNNDLNPRKLERYLALVMSSGIKPVLLLSKADLCPEPQGVIVNLLQNIGNVEFHIISSITGQGLDELNGYICEGITLSVIGSSGVGKSTLINKLLGNETIPIREIRKCDDKGRHMTTSRQMYFLPGGGIIIDTPGLRGLQIIDSDEELGGFYDDIEELARKCRFKNCSHESEPGCAVKEALESGELTEDRFNNYLKLQKETVFFEERKKMRRYLLEKRKMKKELQKKRKQKERYIEF